MLKLKDSSKDFTIVYETDDMTECTVYDYLFTKREKELVLNSNGGDVFILDSKDDMEEWEEMMDIFDKEEFDRWKSGIKKISENPNVNCKLSAVAMTDHNWSVESIEPIFDYVIECFGMDRCIVASNFPVDKLYGSYDDIFNAYKKILEKYTEEENLKLFSTNANKIYKIK